MIAGLSNDLAPRLDYCLFRADATRQELERLCGEARAHRVHGVCVPSSRVELAVALLEESEIKVISMVGFPTGLQDADAKRYETEAAIDQGAQEIEFVLNAGRMKDGDQRYVLREMRDIAEAVEERPVTVALESELLTEEQIKAVCGLALDSGVHAVATGTGWQGAATVEAVRRLREAVGARFAVKAAGGIADAAIAAALLQAGATRLGVSELA